VLDKVFTKSTTKNDKKEEEVGRQFSRVPPVNLPHQLLWGMSPCLKVNDRRSPVTCVNTYI